ncbi:hypothetical protein K1719_026673 [Acacia pycnantha]|nr:hypothetical protein K1719_026673 [Acacia pycnantha]
MSGKCKRTKKASSSPCNWPLPLFSTCLCKSSSSLESSTLELNDTQITSSLEDGLQSTKKVRIRFVESGGKDEAGMAELDVLMAEQDRSVGASYNNKLLNMDQDGSGPLVSILSQERVKGNLGVARQPLVSWIKVDGKAYGVQYEGLPHICFECGKYGHTKDKCPEQTPLSTPSRESEVMSQGHIQSQLVRSLPETTVRALSARGASPFGSWICGYANRAPSRPDLVKETSLKDSQISKKDKGSMKGGPQGGLFFFSVPRRPLRVAISRGTELNLTIGGRPQWS